MPKKPRPVDPQACGTCRHFHGNRTDEFGYCRRFPPAASVQDGAPATLWPGVTSSTWCGEYARILNS